MLCPGDSDGRFGPRVPIECRPFDFTLLFEDAIFGVLPAALFLVLSLCRLPVLIRGPVKVTSHHLAAWKLVALAILLVFHLLYIAFQVQAPILHTKASLPASILQLIAVATAGLLSWLEDQRSVRPSDLMVLYFFTTSVLALPHVRTLWQLSADATTPAVVWTLVTIGTVAVSVLESIHKTRLVHLVYRESSKESTASFWIRSFFIWVLPLFHSGFSTVLSIHDMPEVDRALQGKSAERKLQLAWSKDTYYRKHRLVQVTFRAYFRPFVSAIFPRLCLSVFTFCQPFLISATLGFLNAPSTTETRLHGPALVGAYVLTYLGMTVAKAVYWRQTFRFNTTVRAGLISLIYRQTAKLQSRDFKDKSAITLMSTDVERIVVKFFTIHEAWAAPVEVSVAIFLLSRQLGVACIIPAIISLLAVSGTIPVSSKSNTAQKLWIERVQARLSVVSSMLHDMKAVKMLGLSEKLFQSVSRLREVELQVSERFRYLLVGQVILSNLPLTLAPFATFTIFAIIALVKNNETLLSTRMFTSLSLISLMTSPLLTFIQALPALWESLSCFDRIERYCSQAPLHLPDNSSLNEYAMEMSAIPRSTDSVMKMSNASFCWSADAAPVLHDLDLSVKKETITAIIGPVGGGKTSLLESILGETDLKTGSMSPFHSKVAYCPQTPWIMNDTIRQNITGPQNFDPKWYNFVVWACALDNDFQSIPRGDLSKAGSSGITLSGGQKQRISLARAVYSRAPTLVLDDVFSGLDTRSVSAISSRLLAADGHFRESGRTVIIATHNYRLLPYADEIVVVEDGGISQIGPYDQLSHSLPQDDQTEAIDQSTDRQNLGSEDPTQHTNISSALDAIDEPDDHPNTVRRDGKWSVYSYYFQSAGWAIVIPLTLATFLFGFANEFSTVWLQQWSDANEKHPNQKLGLYLGIYAFLFGITLITLFFACWALFIRVITKSGLVLHSNLLKTTLSAPFSFFQKVDAGLTTNRFSQDLELIDMNLPIYALNASVSFVDCAVQIVILCFMGKYLTITIPAVGVIVFFVQSYYLRTSRQVRLLDIEAKAPLFTHFLEAMQGISVIRAMRWQVAFHERLQTLLSQSQKPFYMLFCIQQWLQLVLDCIVMALAVILVSLVVSLKSKFSAGAIGVALNLILSFNQDLMQLIRSWTLIETSIGAVSRVQDFVENTPSEEQDQHLVASVPSLWPSRGEIIFDKVMATYNPHSAPILNDVTLSIRPGEKIAICGPSGSGKTSTILGLLQMIGLQEGSITVDGVDLSTLPCSAVRSRINVVPQEPFFMPGSLRFNLDRSIEQSPISDARLIHALETVGLWTKVRGTTAAGGELDQTLSVSDWSMGERQLLALARALVLKSPILVLDEATSSVDWETEDAMQGIIEREFASQTIVSVMHRLRYIERFDRVALLKRGRLVECDSPQALLARDSEFRAFYQAKRTE
ncbi:uncharacterized protein N7459_002377 [Penicillium hispanicum]|uniref:uncharacterized protein n=1 Tax=Penicillium hispanicum TaxID=1080232 RepID=UPI00253F8354|nr:uncharacterized protein N7459_002377 [Penicillium hispanicum]KAJ5592008.1 hypothetical protein N7459_002377 [Penicillium hispanicum]